MCNSSIKMQNLRFPQPATLDFYANDYDYHAISMIWIGFAHIHGLSVKMINSMYLFDRLARVFQHSNNRWDITQTLHPHINRLLMA